MKNKTPLKKIASILLIVIMSVIFASSALSQVQTYNCTIDATTRSNSPTTNYGGQTTSAISSQSTRDYHGMVGFNMTSEISGDVLQANVSIYPNILSDGGGTVEFYYCDDNNMFPEMSITYNTMGTDIVNCSAQPVLNVSYSNFTLNTWYNFDITEHLNNDTNKIFVIYGKPNPLRTATTSQLYFRTDDAVENQSVLLTITDDEISYFNITELIYPLNDTIITSYNKSIVVNVTYTHNFSCDINNSLYNVTNYYNQTINSSIVNFYADGFDLNTSQNLSIYINCTDINNLYDNMTVSLKYLYNVTVPINVTRELIELEVNLSDDSNFIIYIFLLWVALIFFGISIKNAYLVIFANLMGIFLSIWIFTSLPEFPKLPTVVFAFVNLFLIVAVWGEN